MQIDLSPNLQKWLRDFSQDPDREAAFDRIGEHLVPLIFHIAYRKSGDHELSKDITQSVLMIISRKAPSLVKHTAILGWVHETTRTETLRTIRSHARQKNRERAAMEHFERSPETNREVLEILDEAMRCLSASEKELVLMKYFEDRSYQSIIAKTGRSESAEKMRLKRALEKMSRWLGCKGVALSVTGLASVLSAEMAKGAPAIAMNSTAAISVLSSENMITQTLATMSPAKLALGTGLLVLAGAAMPISSAWKEYREARETRVLMDHPVTGSDRSRSRITNGEIDAESVAGIVDGLTDLSKDKYSTEELGLKLIDAVTYEDQVLLHQLDQILVQFDVEELGELAAVLKTHLQGNAQREVLMHLMDFLPKDMDHPGRLSWVLEHQLHDSVVLDVFRSWSHSDSTAAREWLIYRSEAGELEMNGISNDPEGVLWRWQMEQLQDDPEGDFKTKIFLSLPADTRRRLGNYRHHLIPSSIISSTDGLETVVEIIKGIDDSSERFWINALVTSVNAPKTLSDLEQWLADLGFNEIEHNWAVSFFKEGEQK